MPGSRHFSKPKFFFSNINFFFPWTEFVLKQTEIFSKPPGKVAKNLWWLQCGEGCRREKSGFWIGGVLLSEGGVEVGSIPTQDASHRRHIVPKTIRLGCPETFEWTVKFYFFPRLLCVFGDLMTTNLFRDGISSAKVFTRFGQEISNCWEPITKLPNLKRRPVLELSSWWSKWTPNVLGIPSVK